MEKERLNALVTKARAGDTDAISDLIQASYQDMYYYALKIVKNDDLAADVTQDSCLEIIQTICNLKESAAFVTWCRRIVYHQSIKRLGKSRMVPLEENEDGETILDRIPDEAPNTLPEEIMENRDLRRIMLEMIDELPESQRSALMLYYYERLSVKQIAEIQDENESTVKSRLFHGRKAVQKQVEDYEAKNGIKLHSIGILPLLYYLFQAGKAEANAAAAALAPQAMAAVAPAIAATSGTTVATAAAAAGTTFLSSLAFKITAGVLAVALAVGGIVIGTQSGGKSDEEDAENIISQPASDPEPSEHIHGQNMTWKFDNDAHWEVCSCGMVSDARQAHTYSNGQCTVCHMPEPAGDAPEGLNHTQLAGMWTNFKADYIGKIPPSGYLQLGEELLSLQIMADGAVVIDGVAHTFISCDSYPEENYYILYYRATPYDPAVDVSTEVIMNTCPVVLSVEFSKGFYTIDLTVTDLSNYQLLYYGKFYRESDYADYEKVPLTAENFFDYYTLTVQPVESYYINTYFDTWQKICLAPRSEIGFPSWYFGEINYQTSWCNVIFDINNNTSQVEDKEHILSDNSELVYGYGAGARLYSLLSTDGYAFPKNGIVEWFGKVIINVILEDVEGVVFVPKT